MTNKEVRQKALECGEAFMAMCDGRQYEVDEDLNKTCHCGYSEVAGFTDCAAVYGYEHGYADGIEEGTRLALDANKQLIEKVCSRFMALALDQSSNLFACKNTVSRDDVDSLIKNCADVVERYFLKK